MKYKKRIWFICSIMVILLVTTSILFFLTREKKEVSIKKEDRVLQATVDLRLALQNLAEEGTDTATLLDIIPFDWDSLIMEKNGKEKHETYTFIKSNEVICTFQGSKEELGFGFEFNYRERDRVGLIADQKVSCDIFERKGIPEVRIHNEEYARMKEIDEIRIERPKQDINNTRELMKEQYGYDVSAADASVMDVKNNQLKGYREKQYGDHGFEPIEFVINKSGIPVVYNHVGVDEYSLDIFTWNEKKNLWDSKPNEMGVSALEAMRGKELRGIQYNEDVNRYIGFVGDTLICFDEKGEILYKSSTGKLVESPYNTSCVKWVSKNELLMQSEEEEIIRYNMKKMKITKVYEQKGSLLDVDESNIYLADNERQQILVIDIKTGKEKQKINFKGVKLLQNSVQIKTEAEELWFKALYKIDVLEGQIYMLTKNGLYVWDEQKRLWELWMEGSQMKGLTEKYKYVRCFKMVNPEEFYTFVSYWIDDDVITADFYGYQKISDEPKLPLNQATDDFNIKNGVITTFEGVINKERTLDIPAGVTEIAEKAFAGYNYNGEWEERITLKLPKDVKIVGDTFADCFPLNLELPDGQKKMLAASYGDYDSYLRVIVPKSVISFNAYGMYCPNMEWEFTGKCPEIEREMVNSFAFAKIIVPKGRSEEYINEFMLDEKQAKKVVER